MTNQTLIDELRQQAEWYRIEDPDNADPPEWTPDESNEVADLLQRAADALSRPTEGCTWTQDRYGNWDSSCGQTHVLLHDGPRENGMRFCCYCGGALREPSGNSGELNPPTNLERSTDEGAQR